MASKSKSNFLLLLSAITLIIIIGGLFIGNFFSNPSGPSNSSVSPTPVSDPTANRKTYTNTVSGYTVEYPRDMAVRLICPGGELILLSRQADTADSIEGKTCEYGDYLLLKITTSDKKIGFPQMEVTPNILNSSKTTIDGIPADKFTISYHLLPPMGTRTNYLISFFKNKKYYQILSTHDNFLGILSTFKFL